MARLYRPREALRKHFCALGPADETRGEANLSREDERRRGELEDVKLEFDREDDRHGELVERRLEQVQAI